MWCIKSCILSGPVESSSTGVKFHFFYKLFGLIVLSITSLLAGAFISPCFAQSMDNQKSLEYLKNLSIEELLQTEVTSVSKKSEQLFDAAAAVFVITQEDIKRAGVRSIAEALRMVPGLQVAHINASTYAITARGFNEWFSNKLLVLMDGRSLYTPLFSGVFWDIQDTVLEDIQRIEVIRGPGATLWGANAVNGVINIITKHSKDTQGGLLVGGYGNIEKPLAVARYGGTAGQNVTYRVYAKGFQRDSFKAIDSDDANDQWENKRAGFRTDLRISPKDCVTLQGETYQGSGDLNLELSGYITPPYTRETKEEQTYHGGHLISNWQHTFSDNSETTTQIYYENSYRDQVVIEEERQTLDVDFKHQFNPFVAHEMVWGMGYRWTGDETKNPTNLWMDPSSRQDQLYSAFIQDDIMILPDKVWFTLGSKFEHNSYTGFEVQPSGRIRWKPTNHHTIWASVARAVRTPSRSDHDMRVNLESEQVPLIGVIVGRIEGDESFESEDLLAYEAGLRWQRNEKLSMDLTAFYNIYNNLRVGEAQSSYIETTPSPAHIVIPIVFTNDMEGETYGFEALTTLKPVNFWKLNLGYAWFGYDLDEKGNVSEYDGGMSPHHQVQLRSYLNLPWSLSLDMELYLVDELKAYEIPAYARFDVRLGWEPNQYWALSLNIENLFDDSHQEFPTRSGVVATKVPRIVYGQVTYHF